MKIEISKFSITQEEAQQSLDNTKDYVSRAQKALEFMVEQNFSSINKEEFVKVLEVLFASLKFQPTWSDYSSLWGSYETDYGSSRENMEDPEVLKKYLKDLAQEFIWINA
mmetsp:Transcript_31906/g.28262  ORF Transcript_31906/g.28262 Transcript_31906/m.28262 type:complete len:110 (-) Transcript_31906:293-622(-)